MTEIAFCSTALCAYDWLEEFQVVAAAIMMVVAVFIVYLAVRSTAKATLRAAHEARDAQQRATAATIWAELAFCLAKVTTDGAALRNDEFLRGGTVVLRLFRTPAFDSRPADLAALPADEAFAAARAYQLVKSLDDTYRDNLAAKTVTRVQRDQLLRALDQTAEVLTATVGRLRETAGISKDRAERAIAAYQESLSAAA